MGFEVSKGLFLANLPGLRKARLLDLNLREQLRSWFVVRVLEEEFTPDREV